MERYQFNSNFREESGTDWTYVSEYIFAMTACGAFSIMLYLNYRNSIEQGGTYERNNKFVKWHLEDEIQKAKEDQQERQRVRKEKRKERREKAASEKAESERKEKEEEVKEKAKENAKAKAKLKPNPKAKPILKNNSKKRGK